MKNNFFILILFLLKLYESKLISVFGLVNQGSSIPNYLENDLIPKNVSPFIERDLIPAVLKLHSEMGNKFKSKYLNVKENNEYKNFSNVVGFYSRIKIYSSSSREALLSSIGQVNGIFPEFTPKVMKFNNTGVLIEFSGDKELESSFNQTIGKQLKGSVSDTKKGFSNKQVFKSIPIEYFPQELDVVLNSRNCLNLKKEDFNMINTQIYNKTEFNNEYIFNRQNLFNISNQDYKKILFVKNIFPQFFINFCLKTQCKNDESFKDLKFFDELFRILKVLKDINYKIPFSKNRLKNNYSFSKKNIDDIFEILHKYHLLYIYSYNEKISKKISTPLFRFFNGYLENSKSRSCQLQNEISTQNKNKIVKGIKDIQNIFVKLKKLKPIDILRKLIDDTKCKKLVLLISNRNNLITFIKSLINYEDVLSSIFVKNIEDKDRQKLIMILDPGPADSFIFEIHEHDDKKIFVRIFYNLQEISELQMIVKFKIPYIDGKGINMDDLVSKLNEYSDSKIKYKEKCSPLIE